MQVWTDRGFDAFRSVAREVFAQRQVLRNDAREPSSVRINKAYLEALLQDEVFLVNPGEGGYIGLIYGLPTFLDDEPGIRVLPKDWQGYGQGTVR